MQFVRLLLNNGVVMQNFLNAEILRKLYNSVRGVAAPPLSFSAVIFCSFQNQTNHLFGYNMFKNNKKPVQLHEVLTLLKVSLKTVQVLLPITAH